MHWILYCEACEFEKGVRRESGESLGDAIERLGADHDDLAGHEVRGRRERGGRTGG